eukprot:3303456-Prorocentrum_lima.AAC.1
MTSSLVGSEMCIRDRVVLVDEHQGRVAMTPPVISHKFTWSRYAPSPVSYTHLTLPTICSV